MNFQTMVSDLTGMSLSNSSLLDEATAAAEAMTMCSAIARGKKPKFLVSVSPRPIFRGMTMKCRGWMRQSRSCRFFLACMSHNNE